MEGSTQLKATELDEEFRSRLDTALQHVMGRSVEVAMVDRSPSPFATLFPAEVLAVELVGGERVSLFLKQLGEEEQADHPEKRCREREVRIYEQLLGDPALPVAQFCGAERNQATRRHELFLEYVDGLTLNYQDLEHWLTAARRLADLHAHFASRADSLVGCDFLLRIDALHFREWGDRAVAAVASRSPGLAAKLERVTDHGDIPAQVLTAQTKTLVHNDLSPKNVIADPSASPARICFVDWEMAGVGCGVMDIVHLKYGLDDEDDRRVRAAYCAELAGTDLLPSGRADLRSVFAASELHRTLHRLAHVNYWRTTLETVDQWVADAHRLRKAV